MTTRTSILYLKKDTFQFYSPFLATILEFGFVPEIVQDLDVINKELLESLIKAFVTNNKIAPSNLLIVVADSASFIKDLVTPKGAAQQPTQEELQTQARTLIENVPFENVASKLFKLPTGIRVYTTNQELYEAIKIAFEKQNFIVELVVPSFVFGSQFNTNQQLDAETVTVILKHQNAMKQYNLLIPSPSLVEALPEGESEDIPGQKPAKTNKKRLFLLVGVFVVLIIIMVIVYFVSNPPAASGK